MGHVEVTLALHLKGDQSNEFELKYLWLHLH